MRAEKLGLMRHRSAVLDQGTNYECPATQFARNQWQKAYRMLDTFLMAGGHVPVGFYTSGFSLMESDQN
jgi:hypothetical protein